MIVYRVEDELGGGPYNGDRAPDPWTRSWSRIVNGHEVSDPVHQPSPNSDIPEWRDSEYGGRAAKYRFGFASVEQVYKWFLEDARAFLKASGYGIAQYEVPDEFVLVGENQVAFSTKKAKLLQRLPIDDQMEMNLITKASTADNRSTEVDIPF